MTKKEIQERQVSRDSVEEYERRGWKKVRNAGKSSAIVQREAEVKEEPKKEEPKKEKSKK